MRKALIVGIDRYADQLLANLKGCVNDAKSLERVLCKHDNGDPNFECQLLIAEADGNNSVTKLDLKKQAKLLFEDNSEVTDIALFYFAGHGKVSPSGPFLLSSDAEGEDEGFSLSELIDCANKSHARHRLIVLDCCHAGMVGGVKNQPQASYLNTGVIILTAANALQEAKERAGAGVFTGLMVQALSGGAADLVGQVTPASVYAFVDQSLGPWRQRPVFKANVQQFISLRDCKPAIRREDLRMVVKLFTTNDHLFKLDPSFEPRDEGRKPNDPPANEANVAKFRILQSYNRLHLLIPIGADHMWNAAMEYKSCQLTPLGQHYWRLVNEGRI